MFALGTIFATLLLAAGCGGTSTTTTTTSTRTSSGPQPKVSTMAALRKSRVTAVVTVGGAPNAPDWQAQASDELWVANSAKHAIQRIDPRTNAVTADATVRQPCSGLTAAFGSVWSLDCGRDQLVRSDARTSRTLARLPLTPATDEGLITSDAHNVWVPTRDFVSHSFFLAQVDPRTNKIAARVAIPSGLAAAASGFGSIWVTSPDAGTVERVDPAQAKVIATIRTHPAPRFLATGMGSVWVLNQSDGSVSKIDPNSNEVTATIPVHVPGEGGCIAAGLGSVWVTMPKTPLSRIDPKTNQVTERYAGPGGDCLSTGFGSVWLSNHEFGNVWRIKP
jgi:virginiamycin B lyase